MIAVKHSFSVRSLKSVSKQDEARVREALDGLVADGLAVLDHDVGFFPRLHLLSGEIFVPGDNWVVRIR
jgi:hypothetical protein